MIFHVKKQFISIWSKIFIFIYYLFLLSGSVAQARFSYFDADLIDQEELLDTEYYSDTVSYAYPVLWKSEWNKHDIGYRISAGSLDCCKFFFKDEIKLKVETDSFIDFSFLQNTRSDYWEDRTEREIRLIFKLPSSLHLSLLIDAETNKKWTDLGAAFGMKNQKDQWLEAFFWLVDPYYNSKETNESDSYTKKTYTFGMEGNWQWQNLWNIYFLYEKDTPLKWERLSQHYTYGYERDRYHIKMSSPINTQWFLDSIFWRMKKNESKIWTGFRNDGPIDLFYSKSMNRLISIAELALRGVLNDSFSETGIRYIFHDAQYENNASQGVTDQDRVETVTPSSIRKEWMVYSNYFFPLAQHVNFQPGLYVNMNNLLKNDQFAEIKLQTAFEANTGDNFRVLLNVTWDVDYAIKTSFARYWGGGNIQISALF